MIYAGPELMDSRFQQQLPPPGSGAIFLPQSLTASFCGALLADDRQANVGVGLDHDAPPRAAAVAGQLDLTESSMVFTSTRRSVCRPVRSSRVIRFAEFVWSKHR
jgi:hypothetical protein